jgi:hypothetical protein
VERRAVQRLEAMMQTTISELLTPPPSPTKCVTRAVVPDAIVYASLALDRKDVQGEVRKHVEFIRSTNKLAWLNLQHGEAVSEAQLQNFMCYFYQKLSEPELVHFRTARQHRTVDCQVLEV